MRVKILAPVSVLLMLLCWSADVQAQDELPGPDFNSINTSTDQNTFEEKPLLMESESRASKPMQPDTASGRTHVAVPVRKTTPAEPKKKEESDPMNFNFLFYILQTFKSSDLMEN